MKLLAIIGIPVALSLSILFVLRSGNRLNILNDNEPHVALDFISVLDDDQFDDVVTVSDPQSPDVPTGELRWDVVQYKMVVRNSSAVTLTNVRVTIEPSQGIISLFGRDPFPKEDSDNEGWWQGYNDPIDLGSGMKLQVIRAFSFYLNPTTVVGGKTILNASGASEFRSVKDQITVHVAWDGGSHEFSSATSTPTPAPTATPCLVPGC